MTKARFFALIVAATFASSAAFAQDAPAIEPRAVEIMENSARFLEKQPALAVGWFITYDEVIAGREKVTNIWSGNGTLVRGVGYRSYSERGDQAREYVFDGSKFTAAAANAGYFANKEFDGSFDDLVLALQTNHALTLPVWELFSAERSKHALGNVEAGTYLGETLVAGQQAHHLAFREVNQDWQIWISANEERPLPLMVVGTDPYKQGWPQFHAFFFDWNLSPETGDGFFEFVPGDDMSAVSFPELRSEAPGGDFED